MKYFHWEFKDKSLLGFSLKPKSSWETITTVRTTSVLTSRVVTLCLKHLLLFVDQNCCTCIYFIPLSFFFWFIAVNVSQFMKWTAYLEQWYKSSRLLHLKHNSMQPKAIRHYPVCIVSSRAIMCSNICFWGFTPHSLSLQGVESCMDTPCNTHWSWW